MDALRTDRDSMARALRVMRKVKNSYGTVRAWHAQAREMQRMYDGHQWDDYDKVIMQQAKRPVLVFNEIRKVMRSLTGLERLNRTDVRFITRALDSPIEHDTMGDLASEAVAAVDELSEAAYERSLAVKDLGNTGMGWFEVYVDFSEDLDGQVLKQRIPWDEMYWDQSAKAIGLRDSDWRCRKREVPREEFERRWGKEKLNMTEAAAPEPPEWTINKYELVTPNYSLANQKANQEVDPGRGNKHTITVFQFQERYEATVYRLADPDNPNRLMEISEDLWKDLKKDFQDEELLNGRQIPLPTAVKQTKTKYRQIYVANGIELEDPVDLPGNYWTLLCLTGEWDQDKKMFVGVIPDMVDPQRTKNKALSSGLDYYIHNAKGGTIFEKNTFVNETRARDEWTKHNAWVAVQEGKIDKVKPREFPQLPQGLQVFYEASTQAITDVIGLGPEFFGMAEGELGQQTQQGRLTAALSIFGWFFDEINRFRKEEARVTYNFVQEFMTDGQLMEIGGPFNGKSIPLLKSNLPEKYRLAVDESVKHNPNLKARVWQDLQPIIPSLMKASGGMEFLMYCLKFTYLPAQLIDQLQKTVIKASAQAQQAQAAAAGKGQGPKDPPALQAAKTEKLKADAQKSLASAKAIETEAKLELPWLILEALKVNADAKEKREQNEINVLNTLSSLIPGAKGLENPANGNGKTENGERKNKQAADE
jgi:hypothetical protein